jgi:hypothetical protein
MKAFSFGAREHSIIQCAYTVDEIQVGMRPYTDLLHIRPWFLIGPFVPAKGRYRGAVTQLGLSLAVAVLRVLRRSASVSGRGVQ